MFDVLFNNIFLDSFCFLSFLLQRKSYIKVLERSRIHTVVVQHGVRSGITNPETKSVPCLRSTFTHGSSLFFIPLVRLETLRRKQISWQRSLDYRFPEWTGLQPTRRKPLRSSKACQLYFAGPLKDKSEEEQVSYLLIWSGEEGIELVSTWSLTTDEKKKLITYWEKFEDFVVPRSNFRLARYKLCTLQTPHPEAGSWRIS